MNKLQQLTSQLKSTTMDIMHNFLRTEVTEKRRIEKEVMMRYGHVPFRSFPPGFDLPGLKKGVTKQPKSQLYLPHSLVGPISWDTYFLLSALEIMRHHPKYAKEYATWLTPIPAEDSPHSWYDRFVLDEAHSPYADREEEVLSAAKELGAFAQKMPMVFVDFPAERVIKDAPDYVEEFLPSVMISGHAQLARALMDGKPNSEIKYIKVPGYISDQLIVPEEFWPDAPTT